ncbi:MAG TPA: DUF1015 domain-containing protein [Candidatus Hydrogenedentes bacterium]|nr:DUF1015 domain-containing protein [Candidatus Hydrogenedentota bacterium]
MLEVTGFKGFRFSTEKVGALDNVITPPWDVISPEQRRALVERSPYNMAHVLLPEPLGELAPAAHAAQRFDSWLADGALRQDAEDSLYLLEQEFEDREGYIHVRRGFLAVARLPEPDEHTILGHERTFDDKAEDRLRLTMATRANLGPVFVLYKDRRNALSPLLDVMDEDAPHDSAQTVDGVRQRIWRVPYDPSVTEYFADKRLYIADGHHRFRTAQLYRDLKHAEEHPDGLRPYDYVLLGFVPFSDPGLAIYAPHRLVGKPEGFDASEFLAQVGRWFEVHCVEDVPERLSKEDHCAFGLAVHGLGTYLLVLRDVERFDILGADCGPACRDLDVTVLHRGILERILEMPPDTAFTYEPDTDAALEAVREGHSHLGFLLRPIQPEQVAACAEAGETMPQKATYFFPKLPSGAVIHRLV